LFQDDYEAFARHVKLMTSIHAPIPYDMQQAVMVAKRRGDDADTIICLEDSVKLPVARSARNSTSLVMKAASTQTGDLFAPSKYAPTTSPNDEATFAGSALFEDHEEDDEDDPLVSSKENDPSLSPSPVLFVPLPSPRKGNHGKHPLSVLAMPTAPDPLMTDGMTASERNIAANSRSRSPRNQSAPQVKTTIVLNSSQIRGPLSTQKADVEMLSACHTPTGKTSTPLDYTIHEDTPDSKPSLLNSTQWTSSSLFRKDPASQPSFLSNSALSASAAHPWSSTISLRSTTAPANKVTKPNHVRRGLSGSTAVHKNKPRVGLRRL
jgi:ubiquitin-conjugating enzyme E2 S